MEHGPAVGAACPISSQKVSGSAARVNGVIVMVLLALALSTPMRWILAVLAIDFAVKAFARFRYSPICAVSRLISKALRLHDRAIDAAPKRFAAGLGLSFSAAGLALGPLLSQWPAYYVVVGGFALCAALEALAGVCVGCELYRMLGHARHETRAIAETVGS